MPHLCCVTIETTMSSPARGGLHHPASPRTTMAFGRCLMKKLIPSIFGLVSVCPFAAAIDLNGLATIALSLIHI